MILAVPLGRTSRLPVWHAKLPLGGTVSGAPKGVWRFDSRNCQTLGVPRQSRGFTMIKLRGGACHRSSKASRGEDLEVEEPVVCRYSSAFDFHPTLAGMLSPTLIGDQVIKVRQPCQKRLLAPFGMMESLHGEPFPLDGVVGLVSQRARRRHLRVCEHRIPARLTG